MDTFTAASHHDVMLLVFQVAVLLFTARALGEISKRLGQPAVVGEIFAGILLGPSILASLIPPFGHWIVPQTVTQGYLLEVVSLIGAMFMMLITGLETDLSLIRRHARTAIGVSLFGIFVTFFSGFFLGQNLPEFLLGTPDERMVFALFLGTAMAISAIAVIAKVIMDLGLMRRDIGQTLIAAGMSDDTIGWIVLSVVAGLAAGHDITAAGIAKNAGGVILFIVLSLTLGRWLLKRAIDFVGDRVTGRDRFLTLIVILMFAWGAIAQSIQLEAVLGAFVIGIVLSQMRRLPEETLEKVESIALGVFAPVFFAVAGLKVNLGSLFEPRLLAAAGAVIGTTIVAKGTGAYLGARLIGRKDHWNALAFAAGLNTRGAMDIIIATIGLSLAVFSRDMFSIIVLMAMTNSLLAPAALRWVLKHVQPSDQELARLEKEEKAESSLIARIHRVLLPLRLRPDSSPTYRVEARILERLSKQNDIELTLLTITPEGRKQEGENFLERVKPMFNVDKISRKVVEGGKPAEAILDEAGRGYDLMVMGAAEEAGSSSVLFNPMVDYLVRVSPCPTMVVRTRRTMPDDWDSDRILVPTNGSLPARRSAELAFALARFGLSDEEPSTEEDETKPTQMSDEKVLLLNVVVRQSTIAVFDPDSSMFQRQFGAARQIVDELRELGESQGVRVDKEVKLGRDPEGVIIDVAREEMVDLIIIGTDVRAGSQRLFLGPKVERILNSAPCPVIVFNSA